MKRLLTFLLLGGATLLTGCAHNRAGAAGDRGEEVEAEGWAVYEPLDPIGSRQRALADAQRRAVEKVTGVRITSLIRVDRAVSVENRIEAVIGGFIKRYEIVDHEVSGGFIRLRIEALVVRQRPEETVLVGSIALSLKSPVAEGMIDQVLRNSGFSIVEGKESDIVVTGKARTYSLRGGRAWGFRSFRARVTLKAVRRSTGEVWRVKREASAMDVQEIIAARKAIEGAARLAGEALAAELAKRPVRLLSGL